MDRARVRSLHPFRAWRRLRTDIQDIRGFAALGPLGGGFVPWSVFSISPAALTLICNDVMGNARKSLLEFGAGTSTVVLARLLAQQGGHLTSIEHDEIWLERVRGWLSREGLTELVTLVHAPLAPCSHPEASSDWYDEVALKGGAVPAAPFDVVLVDGPPAGSERDGTARFPALPFVLPYLAPDALIVLDDGDRSGEREIVRRWGGIAPGIRFTYRTGAGRITVGIVGDGVRQ